MISIPCPGCGKVYKLDEKLIGKKGRCKSCDSSFSIERPVDESLNPDLRKETGTEGGKKVGLQGTKPPPIPTPRAAVESRGKEPPKSKTKPVPDEDDEFAGLNSVSSVGESIDDDDLPPPPPRGRRSTTSRSNQDSRSDDDEESSRPKKRRTAAPSRQREFSMGGGSVSATIAAAVSGAAGALIWGGIAYATHMEVGYVAWGIGGLVGFCVQCVSGDLDDNVAGIIAAIGSVFSILAGKLLAAHFLVTWILQSGQLPAEIAAMPHTELVMAGFMASFGVVDIVFFVLAIATAYKLGAGLNSE